MLRAAGLKVVEVPGWEKRGADDWGPIEGVTCHATAGARGGSTSGEISVLINGSPSAPPPIAQLYLARDGVYHVVASGRCNHNLIGWGGPNKGLGNYSLIGIEAGNDNRGEPWPKVQLDAYRRGVAAICRHLNIPASRVAAHWQHQPGDKSDPVGIDMNAFRAAVAALIEEDDMPIDNDDVKRIWNTDGILKAASSSLKEDPTNVYWAPSSFLRSIRDAVRPTIEGTAWQEIWPSEGPNTSAGRAAARAAVSAYRAEKNSTAILAALGALGGGEDVEAVVRRELEASEERERAEREVELAPLHEALDTASTQLAELAELIRQAQSGQLNAEEVVAEIARRLAPADESS